MFSHELKHLADKFNEDPLLDRILDTIKLSAEHGYYGHQMTLRQPEEIDMFLNCTEYSLEKRGFEVISSTNEGWFGKRSLDITITWRDEK